jgi:hypothetical protein
MKLPASVLFLASQRPGPAKDQVMAEPFGQKLVPDSLDNGSVQQAKGKPFCECKKRGHS